MAAGPQIWLDAKTGSPKTAPPKGVRLRWGGAQRLACAGRFLGQWAEGRGVVAAPTGFAGTLAPPSVSDCAPILDALR